MEGMPDARRNKSSQFMLLVKVNEFLSTRGNLQYQPTGSKSRETVCDLEYTGYETSMAYSDSFSKL
jgi:hypothetical protein